MWYDNNAIKQIWEDFMKCKLHSDSMVTEPDHYLLKRYRECEFCTKFWSSHYILAHIPPCFTNRSTRHNILAGWPAALIFFQPFHHITEQFGRKASPPALLNCHRHILQVT